MRFRSIYIVIIFLLINLTAKAQITVSGSVGVDGPYTSLTNVLGAFAAINGAAQTGATITITITGDVTTETGANSLNAGAWTTVTINPSGERIISGSVATPLIDFNGADNVNINGLGGANSLTITNTSTSSVAATSTIRFINDATNNTVQYCIIKGATTDAAAGIIFFSTAGSGSGNDNNTIDNCDITSDAAGRPINSIYSLGTASRENSGNTISNNNIYDFFNSGTTSNGIYVHTNSTSWDILSNSFYETASFVPTADVEYAVIKIENTGGGFTIRENYIGGNSALCGGSAWGKTNAANNTFYAIYLDANSSSGIHENTIRNFNWLNSGNANWTAIHIEAGPANIGTDDGNTIGATSGTGSITVTAGATDANVYGIHIASSGTVSIEENNIGSITAANSNSNNATNFYGIYKASIGGRVTISDNIIGSGTTNSIHANSPSSTNKQSVYGIYSEGTMTSSSGISISENIISNLTNGTTNTNAATQGCINGITTTDGKNTIEENEIYNLSIANANTTSDNTASVIGICQTSTDNDQIITEENEIYSLSNTYTSFAGNVIGVYYSGGTGGSNEVSSVII